MRRRVNYLTYGCKVNQYETERIKQILSDAVEESVEAEADIYIINTCTVTKKIDDEILRKIRQIKKHKNKKLVLTGCMVMRNDESGLSGQADFIIPNDKKFDPDFYPDELKPKNWHEKTGRVLKEFGGKNKAFVKVEDGCDRFCTYCTVPLVRGSRVISRAEDEIIIEAESLTNAGYRELVLTGVNLGLYGRAENNALEKLLKRLVSIKGIGRVRLSSIGPKELSNEAIDFIAENRDKICGHFHMSMQSGDEKMLKLMNRNYTPDEYMAKASYIIKSIPDAAITTDIIAGFPGEGIAEFENTCAFIKSAPLTRLHVFPYSDRPGTKAEKMKDKVPEQEKKRRIKVLIGIGKAKEKEFAEKNSGKKLTVLVEDNPKAGYFSGYTENYIRVNIKETDSSKKLVNGLVPVIITEVRDGKVYAEII